MKYGYYLAALDEKQGDPELAAAAHARWNALGVTEPGRYDGCSVWADNGLHVRVLARDWFADKFRVAQAMVTW
jgi:hypothetical protein